MLTPRRFDYVKYDSISEKDQALFKAQCIRLEQDIMAFLPQGRAQSLALTALEEVYMWIGKGIRDRQVAATGKVSLQEERTNG